MIILAVEQRRRMESVLIIAKFVWKRDYIANAAVHARKERFVQPKQHATPRKTTATIVIQI